MGDSEFVPFNTMTRIFSRWWMVVTMAVLGGLLGWAFHFFHSPVYEATAIITVTMDFQERELTQYEQDYAFNAAGAVISSTAVMDQITTEAQKKGILISSTQLLQQMFLETRQSVWELHMRDQDPQVAADLANIWAQVAIDALNSALERALQAEQDQVQIYRLDDCLPIAPELSEAGNPQPTPIECARYSLAEIHTVLQSWTDELVQDKELSFGILPIMEFALTGEASTPENSVLPGQAGLTLSGTMIGFVISLWVTGSRRGRRRG